MTIQPPISRRDFFKWIPLAALPMISKPLQKLTGFVQSGMPNIIVLVFDAWAAGHLPIYGYPRDTMPHLARFADHSLVYHHHISAGTFTATGAASLLTGLYPWDHRALHIRSGIQDSQIHHNLFNALRSSHHTLGYSQNKFADKFLYQFGDSIHTHPPQGTFNLQHLSTYDLPPFRKDGLIAFAAFEENIFYKVGDYDASLFLAPILRTASLYKRQLLNNNYMGQYPKGLPDSTELFLLGDLVEGTIATLDRIESPFTAYLHFYPPHWPYNPTAQFLKVFRTDNLHPDPKPAHPLSTGGYDQETLDSFREKYDAYLASWDEKLGRLFDYLEGSGLTDNSYIFITSDHGEMFERGISGHTTPLIYSPLVHIPLLVSEPGRTARKDIYTKTSSLDLLPTMAHLCGHALPAWAQGQLLPSLGGQPQPDRSIFTLDAKDNSAFRPLSEYSIALTKGHFRLTHYHYPGYESYEFYDLDLDPEERVDLYPSHPVAARHMQDELSETILSANLSFRP